MALKRRRQCIAEDGRCKRQDSKEEVFKTRTAAACHFLRRFFGRLMVCLSVVDEPYGSLLFTGSAPSRAASLRFAGLLIRIVRSLYWRDLYLLDIGGSLKWSLKSQ